MSIGWRPLLAASGAKLVAAASRFLQRGGGTAAPGLVATWIDPNLTSRLVSQLDGDSAAISGTNGKTTTARLLASMYATAGKTVVRNASGSNLSRGIVAALALSTDMRGCLPPGSAGIFEIDEAALPGLLPLVSPSAVLLLNLFRDQLDRYGEVATIARIWTHALSELPWGTELLANADDPTIAYLARNAPSPAIFFGVESAASSALEPGPASDVKSCPACGSPMQYSASFVGHLGHYLCSRCTFARPSAGIQAREVVSRGTLGTTFCLSTDAGEREIRMPLPGMHNVYNALAAAAVALRRGVSLDEIALALSRSTAAFGRMERIEVDGRDILIALAKNPTGLDTVLATILEDDERLHLLLMLNDNTADGRDVSWIWDADFERLEGKVQSVVFGGTRAGDMALRFKYAGALPDGSDPQWRIESQTSNALTTALALTPPGARLTIVPTYTALLDVRNLLSRAGHVHGYWED